MSQSISGTPVAWPAWLSGRRTFLKGAVAGSVGLSAAALFGCRGGDGNKPSAASTTGSAGGKPVEAKAKLLNEDLLALNDPNLLYPYIAPEPDLAPKTGGTYKFGWLYDIASMDPSTASSVTSSGIPNAVGDRLIEYVNGPRQDPNKMELTPSIAKSWEISPDGLTYTFSLVNNAKFHNKPPVNGRPFTAEDVRLVLQRYATVGVVKGNYSGVSSMTAVNATTFQVKLQAPRPDFLNPLASRESVLYAMELVDGGQMAKATDVIGTGAFILQEAIRGDHVKLTANPGYWNGRPYVDGQEWRMIPDQTARLAAFRTGQIDACDPIVTTAKEADALRATNPSVVITYTPVVSGATPSNYNLKNPKFQDVRVRRALSMAYDRQRHSSLFNDGTGAQGLQALPWIFLFDKLPGAADAGGPWFRYDPAEAKKLLQAAGQENLSFELLRSTTYTSDSQLAFLLESWKAIGVNANGKTVDNTAWNSQWQTGTYPDAVAGGINTAAYTTDGYYKDQVATGGGLNRINLSDPEIDVWAKQQTSELDPKARRQILRKIWDRMGDQAYRLEGNGGRAFNASQPWLRRRPLPGPFCSVCIPAAGMYIHKVWLDK